MDYQFDLDIMKLALEESKKCTPNINAFAVGAVIIDINNNIIATGYSRETAENVHAEEVAINKAILQNINLVGATIYSTMEPCGERLSGKKCCADRIIESGIDRCVYGIAEPIHFVEKTTGLQKMVNNGVIISRISEYNVEIMKLNSHAKY